MRSFRDQRLANDYEELVRLQQRLNIGTGNRLEIQPVGGRPYQAYTLIYHCAGYVDEVGTVRQRHQLFLEFPRAYPLEAPPILKRVSPLFHPNIYPHGVFCLGFEGERKWRPGISLESLILHVSRLIRFDPDWVNLNPPANRTTDFWNSFIKKHTFPADDLPFVVGDDTMEVPSLRPQAIQSRPESPSVRPSIRIEPIRVPGRSLRDGDAPRRALPGGPIRVARVQRPG